jgi:hypothetical protein
MVRHQKRNVCGSDPWMLSYSVGELKAITQCSPQTLDVDSAGWPSAQNFGRIRGQTTGESHIVAVRSKATNDQENADEEIMSDRARYMETTSYPDPSPNRFRRQHTPAKQSITSKPRYIQQRWTPKPLCVENLDSSTFDDYLYRCCGLFWATCFFDDVRICKGDVLENGQRHYIDFLIETYGILLHICHKLLAYLRISTPSTADLGKLPRDVLNGLTTVAGALSLSAKFVGDETGMARHDAFCDATMEVTGNARQSKTETQNISVLLSETADTVVKQLLESLGGDLTFTAFDGDVYQWYVDEEGSVARSLWSGPVRASKADIKDTNVAADQSTYSSVGAEASLRRSSGRSLSSRTIPNGPWNGTIMISR